MATATYGLHRPFPLPTNNEVLEELRRHVADLYVVFQQALDCIICSTNNQSTLMTNAKTHQSYTSITQITSKATHLEHFHHYQAPPTTNKQQQEEVAEDVHVDAGLFLAFVPAMNCHDPQQPDRSLKLYLPEEHTAVLEPNTLVFMLGMGAQQWLSTSPSLNLQATRHSLQLTTSTSRAWYGMSKSNNHPAIHLSLYSLYKYIYSNISFYYCYYSAFGTSECHCSTISNCTNLCRYETILGTFHSESYASNIV